MLEGVMNAPAILKELLQALKDLYEKGETHIIYINKLPMTEQDRELLLDTLGKGNVRIHIDSHTQPVEYWETGVYGIWVGVIYDRERKPTLETVEVTFFPELAKSQREDIEESIRVLEERVNYIFEKLSEKAED